MSVVGLGTCKTAGGDAQVNNSHTVQGQTCALQGYLADKKRTVRENSALQGYLAHKKMPTPLGPPIALGIGLQ